MTSQNETHSIPNK